MWPRGAVLQTGQAFRSEALDPLAHRAWADAYGCTEGLRRLPTLNNAAHHDLSTGRRQPGILMDVHSVPQGSPKLQQLQHPRSGPSGQPIETSQLAAISYQHCISSML